MKTTLQSLSILMVSASLSLVFAACGQGGGSTPILSAPQSPQGQKLSACANAKLATQTKVFLGIEGKVCRVRDGKIKDEVYRPVFSAVKKDKRIGIYQTSVFTVNVKDADGKTVTLSDRDRAFNDSDVRNFLMSTCRPLAAKVFTRGELVGDVIFRPASKDDRLAEPSLPGAKNAAGSSDELFGSETFNVASAPVKRDSKSTDREGNPATVDRSRVEVSRNSDFHSQIDFEMTGEGANRQIKIVDEIDAVSSGPIAISQNPADKLSDQRRLFCSQVTLRLGENFGLLKGRDCATRAQAATAAPIDKKAPTGTGGLMKADAGLDSVKVSEEEILEVVKPVCGSI